MRYFSRCFLCCWLVGSGCCAISLPSLFTDHMVLQRNTPIPVWGWATPQEKIVISLHNQKVSTQADAHGAWHVELPPMDAGGPYELRVSGTNTIIIHDVHIGEVWLCSGQSNMAFEVDNALNAQEETAQATWDKIRMFTVARMYAETPQEECSGQWDICSPSTVGTFSAVAYFFARRLHTELDVAVGLINSSWNGTPIEAWIKESALQHNPDFQPIFKRVDSLKTIDSAKIKKFENVRERYDSLKRRHLQKYGPLPARHQDPGNFGIDSGWAQPAFDHSSWPTIDLPRLFDADNVLLMDGAVWFRKKVDLPHIQAGQTITLSLGALDDFDVTYFNGRQVGSTGKETTAYWSFPRVYEIPPELVHEGSNVIVVRIFDNFGGGGFAGTPEQLALTIADHDSVIFNQSLAGTWHYTIEHLLCPAMAPSPDVQVQPQQEPGFCFNGMIYPPAPYGLRGVLWYQGEANVSRAWQYRLLLPAMLSCWRNTWGRQSIPFGIIQLPNFSQHTEHPETSEWAELREAQAVTVSSDTNSGLIVTIDLGEADDIHPRNKQDVGTRSALWALARVYDKNIVYTGPRFASMDIKGKKALLSFSHTGNGLKLTGQVRKGFSIAGKDSTFYRANAKLQKNKVVVWSDSVTSPVAVRYGWADNPHVILYNIEGFPAAPFRTDTWPESTFGKR